MAGLRYYLCLATLVFVGVTPARAASGPATKSVKIETAGPAQATFRTAPILPTVEPTLVQPPGEDDLGQLEMQLWVLINRERLDPSNQAETGGKALPLKWNEKLAAVARAYSEDMLRRGFYAHVNPEGLTPAMRVAAAGIPWQAEGENIAIYTSVAGAEQAFMDEPRFEHNHRSNILSAKFTDVGVGIVRAPNGMYYVTQEFVKTPTDQFVAAQSLSFGSTSSRSASVGR
jgi:uncharacterized protein YkwD